jgi:hypothetical protein
MLAVGHQMKTVQLSQMMMVMTRHIRHQHHPKPILQLIAQSGTLQSQMHNLLVVKIPGARAIQVVGKSVQAAVAILTVGETGRKQVVMMMCVKAIQMKIPNLRRPQSRRRAIAVSLILGASGKGSARVGMHRAMQQKVLTTLLVQSEFASHPPSAAARLVTFAVQDEVLHLLPCPGEHIHS